MKINNYILIEILKNPKINSTIRCFSCNKFLELENYIQNSKKGMYYIEYDVVCKYCKYSTPCAVNDRYYKIKIKKLKKRLTEDES